MGVFHYTKVDSNLENARIIVQRVLAQLAPIAINSVVDWGCGLGAWLRAFKENGVSQVKGYDGKWVDKSKLFDNIDQTEFEEVDFEGSIFDPDVKRYDLAMSLEVAEHINAQYAERFINKITASSNIVLFSAATPQQGGQNHVNEQWPDYWDALFSRNGFAAYDTLRYEIWDDDRLYAWYRQNIHMYVKSDDPSLADLRQRLLALCPNNVTGTKRLVHPVFYMQKCAE